MKALFVSIYPDTPHFETELELISDLLDDGDDVHVLRCTGELAACLCNPTHRSWRCGTCISKIDAGLRAAGGRRLHVETLPSDLAPAASLPAEFASVDELKAYTFEGANLGRGVYSTLCSRINKDTRFDTRRWAADVRRELEVAHYVLVAVSRVLERLRPDRVYVFNGRFSSTFAVLEACRRAGIDYFTHERGGTTDRYLLRKNALPHDIAINHDEILTSWANGPADKSEIARQWYRARRAGQDQSWESFTKAQAVGMLPDGFDASKRNIAVFNSTMEEYASIKSWEPTLYPDEVIGLCRVVESLRAHANVHVYLRVHPNLKNIPRHDNYQLRAYAELAERAPNLTIIWPESRIHTYALLDHSQVTLTFGSTVGAEACFWKRPNVLAGRAIYEGLDCAHAPTTHDELIAMLLGDLPLKDELGALQYGYWETVRGTRFRRFKPTGLYTGEFNGRPCRPSLTSRVQSALLSRLGR